jgi:exonuclease SbcC
LRIETITISGLRSHRGNPPTRVDLSGKSLVAIVGPTGAGKSSILEAICFALYGEATFGGKAYKDLSSDGRSEIAVQMTFSVGEDSYQLVRSVAPSRNDVFGAKATWLRKVDADGKAITHVDQVRKVDAAIHALLGGMDRTQFCQAVLLAQNRFAELLETDERKRTELLDILLGLTALADARKALQQTERAAERNEERLSNRRSGFPADPAAAAAHARARASTMNKLARQARESGDVLEKLVQQAGSLSQDARELEASAALMVAGRDGHELLLDLEGRFADLAAEEARIAGQLEQAETERGLAGRAVDEAQRGLQLAEEEHGSAGTHDVAIQQLDEIDNRLGEQRSQQQAAREANAQLALIKEEMRAATAEKSKTATALAARQQEAEDAEQAAAGAKGALSQVQRDVGAAVSLAEQLTRLVGELENAAADLAEEDAEARGADQDATAEEAGWRQATEALQLAQRAASAAAAAHGHGPGDPCPVCKRRLPSTWDPPASPDLEAALQAEEQTRGACGLARSRKEQAAIRRAAAGGTFVAAAASLQTKAAEVVEAARAGSLPDPPQVAMPDIPSDVPLNAARTTAMAASAAAGQFESWRVDLREILVPLEKAAAAAEGAAGEAVQAVGWARVLAEDARAALSDLQTEQARMEQARTSAESAAEAASARVQKLLQEMPRRWSVLVDPDVPEPVTTAWGACARDREAVAAATDARDEAARALDDVDQRIGSLKQEMATTVNEPLAAARNELSGAVRAVGVLARAVEMHEPDQPSSTSTSPECLDAVRATLHIADEARGVAKVRAQDLERQREQLAIPGKAKIEELLRLKAKADPDGTWISAELDPDDPLSAATSAAVQQVVGAAGAAAAAARGDAERAAQDVEEARTLDESLSRLRAWRSDLVAAIEVLKKENFPAWARDRRIAELVDVASQLLGGMTGGRYRFDSHLRICDEVAGAVRAATTLSGGEKFEAALALALGVAEIAGRSGIRFDTLFLDEGFAGLDQQNLDRALDAIEAEVAQGRRVVLITHIGAVADRIRDVLYVEPDGTGGSKTRWLDEDERFELGADLDLAGAAGGM